MISKKPNPIRELAEKASSITQVSFLLVTRSTFSTHKTLNSSCNRLIHRQNTTNISRDARQETFFSDSNGLS
jgi:hypothetical protein